MLGRQAAAESILAELRERAGREPISLWHEGSIVAPLGRGDEWSGILDRLVEQRSSRLAFVLAVPGLEPTRNEPWFQTFLHRAGLAG